MTVRALLSTIEKNFKILGRSKFSLVAIILVPFLVILLTGYAFNSSGLSGIKVGVYSASYSLVTEDILLSLKDSNFTASKYESNSSCIDSIKDGKTQICVIFPSDLSGQGSSEEIVFYVDYSRINLAYILIHEINSKVSIKSSDLGTSLAQDLINALNTVKELLPEQNMNLEISKNNLQTIIGKSENNLSKEDLENLTNVLISVRESANESSIKSKINAALVVVNILNQSMLNVSDSFRYIKNQSEETEVILEEISGSSNILISGINKVNILEAEKISSPIKTRIESINTNTKNKDYFTPIIISLIALFGSILLSSTFILQERKSRAYFRRFITPTGDFVFLLGNYLTCLIILIAQFVLVFIGVLWILKISILAVLPEMILVLFLATSAFTFIGMLVGYLFKSEETTIFASVLIAALLMFFSNAILPIETISTNFKSAAIFNPLVACDTALKKVMLFGLNLSSILTEIYILVGFLVVFGVLSYLGRRITKRML